MDLDPLRLEPGTLGGDPHGGLTFLDCAVAWTLDLVTGDGGQASLTMSDMRTSTRTRRGDTLVCSWRGCTFGPDCTVTVRWRLIDGLLSGRLSYRGLTRAAVVRIHFPTVTFPEEEDCQILASQGGGLLIRDAKRGVFDNTAWGSRHSWTYVQMQLAAFICPRRSLYFDTRDTTGHIHSYSFQRSGPSTYAFDAVLDVPQQGRNGQTYRMPYPSSIRPFAGGWFEAAEIYKPWARAQRWSMAKRRSPRIDRQAAWVWSRGPSDEVVPPVERLRKDLGLPIALDWYWWHQGPYDTAYPRYLPPREGTTAFTATLRRLKRQDILSQVYLNGMLWDMDDPSWAEGGQESAIVQADGTVKSTVFNAFMKHRLAFMCSEGRPFRARIRQTVRGLRDCGLDSVYLDVIGNAWSLPCSNPAHRHPPGGGCHQAAGFRSMLAQLRRAFPRMLLTSESCAEMLIDRLDTGIVLDPSAERFPWTRADSEPVPLFNAVYHAVFPIFGNYSSMDGIPPYDRLWPQEGKWTAEQPWHRLCPDQFSFEQARCLAWGMQPTIVNLRAEHVTAPEFRESYAFFRTVVRFHHANRDCLLHGEMLPPGRLQVATVPVRFLQRYVFTKEGGHGFAERRLPAVLHSCWQDADGRRRLVLVNYARRAVSCSWQGRDGGTFRCRMPPRSCRIVTIR